MCSLEETDEPERGSLKRKVIEASPRILVHPGVEKERSPWLMGMQMIDFGSWWGFNGLAMDEPNVSN